jgi:hypothetical protein
MLAMSNCSVRRSTKNFSGDGSLFGDNLIDWGLIERHWSDLLRTAISISEGRLSSVTLLRRPGNNSVRTACTGRSASWRA